MAFATALAGLVLLASCGEARQEARWLELRQIRPQSEIDVYLNERLVLHFSEPLDPSSVHPRSVRVAAEGGDEARGRLDVDRDRITFVPAPVLSSALDDGGYRPGTRYTVEVAGFPRPEAIRGESGAMLSSNLRWEFRTVERTVPRTGFLFEDTSSPDRGSALRMSTLVIPPHGPLRLVSEEPVDPSTLHAEDFWLQQAGAPPGPARGKKIPLVAKLVRNDEPEPYGDRAAAVIELRPAESLLAEGRYALVCDGLRLEDFGRHLMLFRPRPEERIVRVERGSAADGAATVEHLESFADVGTRSDVPAREADGTACWDGRGRIEVRLPAAAGDGRDGEPVLAAPFGARDLQAVRWTVPEGATCELGAAAGPVLLRSQGRAHVAGALVRRGGAPSSRDPVGELLARGLAPATLSQLVERVLAEQLDVTLVLAGGDLVIDGRIESDTALVLVAGGRIVSGPSARIDAPSVHALDHLGSPSVLASGVPVQALALELDPPRSHRVAAPLRFVVRSRALPAGPLAAARWLPGAQVHGHDGRGTAKVRYVPEHEPPRADALAVDDPVLIDAPRLRLEIELVLAPAVGEQGSAAWDPPWVDDVLLQFEPRTPEGER